MDFDCGVCVSVCVCVCISIYIFMHVCLHAYIQLHILYCLPYLRKGTAPVEPYDHTSRSRPRKMENTRPGNSVAVRMVHLCHCLPVLSCCYWYRLLFITPINMNFLIIFTNTFIFNSVIKRTPYSMATYIS